MVAIAMTREMGTLGKDVAHGSADALGLKVIHSELVEHDLAKRLGVQERGPSVSRGQCDAPRTVEDRQE